MKYFIITWIISFGTSVDCPTERVFDPVTQEYKTPNFALAVNCMEMVLDTLSVKFETKEDYLRHIELLQNDNRVKSIQVEEVQSTVVAEWARPKPKYISHSELSLSNPVRIIQLDSILIQRNNQ